MNKKKIILIATLLIVFGLSMRLFPHIPNMTPIVAIAFVSSMYLGKRWALILPLTALLFSDVILGMYDWKIMISVYGSFTLIGLLSWVTKKYRSFLPVTLSIIAASLLFYLITNSAVWLFSPWYEKSVSGLLYSYELGLPFLRNMLIGDLLYTAALIGAFEAALAISRVKNLSLKPFSVFSK